MLVSESWEGVALGAEQCGCTSSAWGTLPSICMCSMDTVGPRCQRTPVLAPRCSVDEEALGMGGHLPSAAMCSIDQVQPQVGDSCPCAVRMGGSATLGVWGLWPSPYLN